MNAGLLRNRLMPRGRGGTGRPSKISVPLLRLDPAWAPLRDHPRFQKLIESDKWAIREAKGDRSAKLQQTKHRHGQTDRNQASSRFHFRLLQTGFSIKLHLELKHKILRFSSGHNLPFACYQFVTVL